MLSSMPIDSPMPSPDINAPSPSNSSGSIEDLHLDNVIVENLSDANKYMINSSIENSISDTDVYVPTTVVSNNQLYITPESYNTVQGIFYLYF